MARGRKKTIYICTEGAAANYAVEPSANGSLYSWVPCIGVGDFSDDRELIPTNYFTGRNFMTAAVVGADACSITFTTPLIGLSTAAGDGGSPPADDWLDILLEHCFLQANVVGEGLAAGSASGTMVLDTDLAGLTQEDARAVFETNVPSATRARSQWAIIDTDNATATYDVSPDWTSTPTTAAIMYGGNVYSYNTNDVGGQSLAVVLVEDDVQRTMLGGRCTSLKLSAPKNQLVSLEWSFAFDQYSVTAKGSLPTAGVGPVITPIRSVLNPAFFGASGSMSNLGHVQNIDIDWGFNCAPLDSVNGTPNGRADYQLIALDPKVTVNPPRTSASYDLMRNGTLGRLLVQLGRGLLSGGVLNTCAFTASQAQALKVSVADDQGHLRNAIEFQCQDAGATGRLFQMIRS